MTVQDRDCSMAICVLSVARALDRVVVRIDGELDVSSTPELRSLLRSVIEEDVQPDVVVDLASMTFVDADGLGVLVGALRSARQHGGDLVLSAPSRGAMRVIELAGLRDIFTITGSCSAGGGSERAGERAT